MHLSGIQASLQFESDGDWTPMVVKDPSSGSKQSSTTDNSREWSADLAQPYISARPTPPDPVELASKSGFVASPWESQYISGKPLPFPEDGGDEEGQTHSSTAQNNTDVVPQDLMASFSQASYQRHLGSPVQETIRGLQGNLDDSAGSTQNTTQAPPHHPPASPPDLIRSPFALPHNNQITPRRYPLSSESKESNPLISTPNQQAKMTADALGAHVFGSPNTPISASKLIGSVKGKELKTWEEERGGGDGLSDYPDSQTNNDTSNEATNLSMNSNSSSVVGVASIYTQPPNPKGDVIGTAAIYTNGMASPGTYGALVKVATSTPVKRATAASPIYPASRSASSPRKTALGNGNGEVASVGLSPGKPAGGSGDMLKEFDEVCLRVCILICVRVLYMITALDKVDCCGMRIFVG
jgi:hypothetical protein